MTTTQFALVSAPLGGGFGNASAVGGGSPPTAAASADASRSSPPVQYTFVPEVELVSVGAIIT